MPPDAQAGAAAPTTPAAPVAAPPQQANSPAVTPESIGAAVDPWAGLESNYRPLIETKKWSSPADAVRGYAAAEKLLGKPADELVHVPKAGLTDDMRTELAARVFGRPETPDLYDFGELKDQEGAPPMLDFWRGVAHRLGLGPEQAKAAANAYAQFGQEQAAAQETVLAQQRQVAAASLQQKHGEKFSAMQQKGAHALAVLGITSPEAEGSSELELLLEQAMGPELFFETFARLGEKLGEHRVVDSPGTLSAGNASLEAEVQTTMADKSHPYWIKEHPAHQRAVERVQQLMEKIHGTTPAFGAQSE